MLHSEYVSLLTDCRLLDTSLVSAITNFYIHKQTACTQTLHI